MAAKPGIQPPSVDLQAVASRVAAGERNCIGRDVCGMSRNPSLPLRALDEVAKVTGGSGPVAEAHHHLDGADFDGAKVPAVPAGISVVSEDGDVAGLAPFDALHEFSAIPGVAEDDDIAGGRLPAIARADAAGEEPIAGAKGGQHAFSLNFDASPVAREAASCGERNEGAGKNASAFEEWSRNVPGRRP